jgi:hypothetical protein
VNAAINRLLHDLNFLAEHYPELLDSRIPGTPRPWREPQLTPERRAALTARAEREALVMHTDLPMHLRARSPEELGESPAPLHIDTLDLLVDVLAVADETAGHVAQYAGVEQPTPASSAFADPRPFLRFIAQHITGAVEADPEMLGVVQDNLRPLVAQVSASLNLLRDGQILKAPCFVCRGRTPETPVGGAFTLRVTTLDDDTPAVVCRNPLCEPTEAECGTWLRGSPAWIFSEWTWLADRLEGAA